MALQAEDRVCSETRAAHLLDAQYREEFVVSLQPVTDTGVQLWQSPWPVSDLDPLRRILQSSA
jgi:hypothetical protein